MFNDYDMTLLTYRTELLVCFKDIGKFTNKWRRFIAIVKNI